jgi:hypothetical protein
LSKRKRDSNPVTAELQRLDETRRLVKDWRRWGPYLSERQWATVREDYSPNGNCWEYFPHDHARSRAYRWGEDGLLGFCDRQCRLAFALALWNGKDPILKERLFGLTNSQGNHGEDVKECYFYLDATPTHSYQKALYKYPQAEFPYAALVEENRRRGKHDPEFEITDSGVFDGDRYFDVLVEYAKGSPNDILIRITATNRGAESATLHLIPTIWFRNTWAWGRNGEDFVGKPRISRVSNEMLLAEHASLGRFFFTVDPPSGGQAPSFLFTDNETNHARLFHVPNSNLFVKDAFHDYIVRSRSEAVNPNQCGTKAAAHYFQEIPAGGAVCIQLRLFSENETPSDAFGRDFTNIFADRIREADEFYAAKLPANLQHEEQQVAQQAYAGLLWSKQFYEYILKDWLAGDPAQPMPPADRLSGRNHEWTHLHCRDVLVMPDKWEYPWFAAWDHAFQMVTLAQIDPQLAKDQLILLLREWYMHPSGQLPAHEFGLFDVNPPVHAWACWRVYKMTGERGKRDRLFLERVLQKLLINFTWWVNRKDVNGKNLFAGGFLGLDNISFFDRSMPLPPGVTYAQADGTAWMAFYCLTMLAISMELARENPAYEDIASKFFEHYVAIGNAINEFGGTGLWDEVDGFYYDMAEVEGRRHRVRTRSMVGIVPLFAAEILADEVIDRLPSFKKRMNWFLRNRPEIACAVKLNGSGQRLLAIASREQLQRILRYVLDEREFLSPFGIRALSRFHQDQPFVAHTRWGDFRVDYDPGESTMSLFGGNSNWRGPIWFPLNYLLIEALERYHHFYGDDFRVEYPPGSGQTMNLARVAEDLAGRLTRLFLPAGDGHRPCHGSDQRFAADPYWRDLLLFHEYFHGDTGRGCGASHQTGWTALVTRLLHKANGSTTHTNRSSVDVAR